MYFVNEDILKSKAQEVSKEGKISVYELDNLLNFASEDKSKDAIDYAKSILINRGYIVKKPTNCLM